MKKTTTFIILVLLLTAYTARAYVLVGILSSSPRSPQSPNAPTGVTVTSGDAYNTLSWTASPVDSTHDAATSYNVLWDTVSHASSGTYANTISNVTSPLTHAYLNQTLQNNGSGATLANDTAYYYRVQSVNTVGTADSIEMSGTPAYVVGSTFSETFTGAEGTQPAAWSLFSKIPDGEFWTGGYNSIHNNSYNLCAAISDESYVYDIATRILTTNAAFQMGSQGVALKGTITVPATETGYFLFGIQNAKPTGIALAEDQAQNGVYIKLSQGANPIFQTFWKKSGVSNGLPSYAFSMGTAVPFEIDITPTTITAKANGVTVATGSHTLSMSAFSSYYIVLQHVRSGPGGSSAGVTIDDVSVTPL